MKRRLIPYSVSLVMFLICLSPLLSDRMASYVTDLNTLIIAAAVFGFEAVLFWWMRHTMITDSRKLTVFGLAIKDFFLAISGLAAALAAIYGVLLWLSFHNQTPSNEVRILNRAVVIANGTLIVTTGIAVAYEMRRAGSHLSVHDESWDGASDRRVGPTDRRSSVTS